MTNNSILNDNPLLKLIYNEGWKINNKDSLYGPLALILNSPSNPLSYMFYSWDKLGQGAKKAWKAGNIWDFFDSNYYTLPGYNNLDKVWGGGTIKGILEKFLFFDKDGKLSIGSALLDSTYFIPVGGEATILARLGLTGVSKFGLNLTGRLLEKRAVQTILKGAKTYLTDPLMKWGNLILKKLPRFEIPSLTKMWQDVVKGAKLASLNPVELYNTLKNTGIGKLVLGKNQQNLQNLLRTLNLRGMVKPSELPYIVDFVKSNIEGPASLLKWGLGILNKASEKSILNFVTSSNFKKKYFSKLLDISKSQNYKNIQSALSPYLTSFLDKNVVYNTGKKLYNEYNQIQKEGVGGYINNKINDLNKAVKGNSYVQMAIKITDKVKMELQKIQKDGGVNYITSKISSLQKAIKGNSFVNMAIKIADKVNQESQQVKKQGIVNYAKTKIKTYAKTYAKPIAQKVKKVYIKHVKPVVQKVQKTYNKYVKPIVQKVKNAWNGFKSWLGFKGPADHSSFISRASGFTYQGYTGSRKTISQTMDNMSGNCVDGTLAQVALASSFGIPAEMVMATWNGNPHVYGRINGVDRDIANHALTGNWSRPPAGPKNSDNAIPEGYVVVDGPVYNIKDLQKEIEKITLKVLDRETTFY